MKIGLIVPSYSRDETDWCVPVLRDLAADLAARGLEVHVFALAYPPERRDYRIGAVHVHALGGRGRLFAWARDPRLFARAVGALRDEARRGPFNALHAIFADECGLVGLVAARRIGAPLVVTCAAGELSGLPAIGYGTQLSRLRALAVRLALGGATQAVVPTGYMAALFRQRFPQGLRRQVAVVPWGVDTARFRPRERRAGELESEPRVLCVAEMMRPVKNVPMLVDAFVRAAHAHAARAHAARGGAARGGAARGGARLTLVGGGPRPRVPDGLALEWHEKVAWDALPEVYAVADVFAMASWHEACCMAALEAMACGLPLAGTAVGVLAEVCAGPAPAGLCVAPGDVDGLAGALERLLSDAALRAELGRNARRQAEECYAWEVVGEQFVGLYRSL